MEAKPNRLPAIAAAAALHAGLFALAVYNWPTENTPVTISSVPVQIVSSVPASAPQVSPEPPAEAPSEVVDEVAQPVEAPPPPPPPQPEPIPPKPTPPKPAPPKPRPAPPTKAPAVRPVPPKPAPPAKETPARPTPPKPRETRPFDPSSIADSLSDATPRRPPRPATRPAAPGGAPQTGPISSTGQQSLAALTARLGEIWNLQCIGDTASARPRVLFKIAEDGSLVGKPRLREVSSDPAHRAAGESALRAVQVGEDRRMFEDLPPELYNRDLSITFRADQLCR